MLNVFILLILFLLLLQINDEIFFNELTKNVLVNNLREMLFFFFLGCCRWGMCDKPLIVKIIHISELTNKD